MECPREEEVLSAFVDHEAPASRQRALARHLVNCEKCAAQVGRLLAVRAYLGAEPEQSASLSSDFWARLSHALRLADLMGHSAPKPKQRRLGQPRLALLTGAAALLMALVVGLTWRPPAPPLAPAELAQAHESALGQPAAPVLPPAVSGLQPAAWSTGPMLGDRGMWGPQTQWGQREQRAAVGHEVYRGSPLRLSRFTVPEEALDAREMRRVRVGAHEYYTAREGFTTILAQRAQGEWHLLAADAPLDVLIAFAESHPMELSR